MYKVIGKKFDDLTDDDLIDIELSLGHEFYCHVKRIRSILLRNKKMKKILNRQYFFISLPINYKIYNMTVEYIKDIIDLESLHRYCFDKLYVQNHNITREEKAILYRYEILFKKYPNFRQECWDAFIYLSNKENKSDGENELLEKLNKINFKRYSIDKG